MAQQWYTASPMDRDQAHTTTREDLQRRMSWASNGEQGPHFAPRRSTSPYPEGPNNTHGNTEDDDNTNAQTVMIRASSTAKPESHFKRWLELVFSNCWGAEIWGLVLSVLALAALLVILAYYNSRPLASFGNSTSVNAVISILISVTEFALVFSVAEALCQQKWIQMHKADHVGRPISDLQLFDRAAYTTFGAFRLLRSGLHRNVASLLGCLVIITHLFVGPFTQQAVSYPVRYTAVDGASNSGATIAKAQNFFRQWETPGSSLVSPIRLAVTAAMDQPITNTTLAATWTCPSGNCTYPIFETAGICSTCANVTDQLRLTCAGDDGTKPVKPYTHDFNDFYLLNAGTYPDCNITFPRNASLAPTLGTGGSFQFNWKDEEGWQRYSWNGGADEAQWDILEGFSFNRHYGSTLGDLGFPPGDAGHLPLCAV